MNEQKIIPITTEQPLTIILSDTTCQLVLKYEQQSNSVESRTLKNEEAVKIIGNQVSRYKDKPSVTHTNNIPKTVSFFSQETDDFDNEMKAQNSSIKDKGNYIVFASYNSENFEEVSLILEILREDKGIPVWFDIWDMRPGDVFQQSLQEKILEAGCVLIFIGANNVGPWQNEELWISIQESVRRGVRVIPVLLPKVNVLPKKLLFLKIRHSVNFKSINDEVALERLIYGITGNKSNKKNVELT